MIEEPYRWVEAIANRREYIEHQLAGGSPIAALSYGGGILFLTLGRERQKVFEIYDRIALGAIGHPGDIERLRMAAIEVASTEGFTRSTQDVSLRRLALYSLSPALKAAFEQVYGPPYLARLLFGELGRGSDPNLFVRMEYDGSIHTNGGGFAAPFEEFGVVSGTAQSTAMMERFLREKSNPSASLEEALKTALDAWAVGHLALTDDTLMEFPGTDRIAEHFATQTGDAQFEAAVLERNAKSAITYRSLSSSEVRALLAGGG
jgi:proteasome alpha subunit